jgi:hypothetical protein
MVIRKQHSSAVVPAKRPEAARAGTHNHMRCDFAVVVVMGPRLRGDDVGAWIKR